MQKNSYLTIAKTRITVFFETPCINMEIHIIQNTNILNMYLLFVILKDLNIHWISSTVHKSSQTNLLNFKRLMH